MNFKASETAQKLRGGYYTPRDLASFIARWVSVGGTTEVLEPSCGDGVFFEALASIVSPRDINVTAFEINSDEAQKASSRANALDISTDIKVMDFLEWALPYVEKGSELFDAVVGNPPFIRYQYLPHGFQLRAENIFSRLGCKFTKHTNAWVPFILASVALLRPGGRLGMVVPAEIIHVSHAQSLRSFLGVECKRLIIIDPETLWFSNTLQGAAIILAEKRHASSQKAEGVGIVPVLDREFIDSDPEALFQSSPVNNGKTVAGKWTRALLHPTTRSLLDAVEENAYVHRFDDVAQVDVGIVTGANKFFLVPAKTVERYALHDYAHPMFGRSEHCPGILYDEQQHMENTEKGKPTNFIWFKGTDVVRNSLVRTYIQIGERQNLHTRFKCRIRSPWYSVPSVYSTDVGMLKRSHNAPRLIWNKVNAFTTDTAYRVRAVIPEAEKLVSCFINPLTALSAEVEGRHYGGGVLELVPSEIERLLVPLPPNTSINVLALDHAVRTRPTPDVLAENGRTVLSKVGLAKDDQDCFLDGWLALRNRRQRVSAKNKETKVN